MKFYLFIILLSISLSSHTYAHVVTDKLMSGIIESHQKNIAYIGWTMQGQLYWFNSNDKIVYQKEYEIIRLYDVFNSGSAYYLLASKHTENVADTVLMINSSGNISSEWRFDNGITSMNVSGHNATVIQHRTLITLQPHGKTSLKDDSFDADFILGDINNNPIKCKKPDLHKQSYQPGICSREGKSNWSVTGQWRNANWPIWCGDYLIEKGFYKHFSKDRFIKVTSTQNGEEVITKKVHKGQVVNCTGSRVLYSGKSLFLAEPQTLKTIKKVSVKNLPVWSAIIIGTAVYYVDGIGKLNKSIL